MDAFPALGAPSSAGRVLEEDVNNMSPAERMMRQHQQHLSYEEMRAANEPTPLANGNAGHALNGRPSGSTQAKSRVKQNKQQLDMDSEAAFPSLGAAAAAPKTAGGWGQGPALSTRFVAGFPKSILTSSSNQYTETLVLLLSSIHIGSVPPQYRERGPRQAGEKREEDPKSLPDVLRAIQRRHPTVGLESSTSRDKVTILFRTPYVLPPLTSSTPALIKANHGLLPEERIIRARQELITRVTRKVDKVIMVPAAVKPYVIGQRGRVLKEIIEVTGASVNLPPRDDSHGGLVDATKEADDVDDSEEVEMIPITISGEESAVLDAEDRIISIVKQRTNKITVKLSDIPLEFCHLLHRPITHGLTLSELVQRAIIEQLGVGEAEVYCNIVVPSLLHSTSLSSSHICLAESDKAEVGTARMPSDTKNKLEHISVSGEREQVEHAVRLIRSMYEKLVKSINKVEVEIPKRQHRFLNVGAIQEILDVTGSLVTLPQATDPSEKVVIRGENLSNVQALGLVVTKANACKVEILDIKTMFAELPDPSIYASQVARFLSAKAHQTKLKSVQDEASKNGIKIYLPLSTSPYTTVEIVGVHVETLRAVKESVAAYLTNNMKPTSFEYVEVDKLLHRQVLKKKNPRLKALQEAKGIDILIPPEEDPSSLILLAASKLILGKDPRLLDSEVASAMSKVKEEMLKSLKDLAQIEVSLVKVPQKLHAHILGEKGTTLNAIIGEDKLVVVQMGQDESVDSITIRGSKAEVERVEKEIKRIAEEASVTEIFEPHSTEFEIDSRLVSHLVGKGGSAISKLLDELGVRIEFSDQPPDDNGGSGHTTHSSKKRKHKALVAIVGRKENVEEAKKRIFAHAERLADEVTILLPILAGLDKRAIVGKGGKYLLRLQDTHMVHINIPRAQGTVNGNHGGETESITIRGPKKGVDAVKRELVELMEYERENSNTFSMNISTKSVSRVVGKGGVYAEKIKEDSGVNSIDIDRMNGQEDLSRVTLKGTKTAIAAAKKMISNIVQEVDEEGFLEVKIDRIYHQNLIGRGGSRLRELVKMAGGDDEAARHVHFPKHYEDGQSANLVTIKGRRILGPKIQEQLEAEVQRLKNQVTYGVYVPKGNQPGVIGRGASALKAIQDEYHVVIYPAGWKEWAAADEPLNQHDLTNINPSEIFKIVGSEGACLDVIELLKTKTAGKDRSDRAKVIKKTVMVPFIYHHNLSQNGRLSRELPRGVRLDHGNVPIPPAYGAVIEKTPADLVVPSTRIDLDSDDKSQSLVIGWDLQVLEGNKDPDAEIPWNLSGTVALDVDKAEKQICNKLSSLKQNQESVPTHIALAKVPLGAMPKIIGRGGVGLRSLCDQSGAATVDVVGKTGSDTLRIVGTLEQVEMVKILLNRRPN